MSTGFYDTDLTDAAWAFVAPVLPAARSGGRPRTTNLRAILNAIFYLLRTGCQWRLLPREFPPFGTVYHYFRSFAWLGRNRRLSKDYEYRVRRNHERLVGAQADQPVCTAIDAGRDGP
jgi:putative transposase